MKTPPLALAELCLSLLLVSALLLPFPFFDLPLEGPGSALVMAVDDVSSSDSSPGMTERRKMIIQSKLSIATTQGKHKKWSL